MQTERVICSQQMVTVFVEHAKVIAKVLKKYYGLTPTEFCILRAVYLSDGRVEGVDFASFLCLKRSSISTALSALQRLGFVEKEASAQDRRGVVVTETPEGVEATRKATADIYGALTSSFWRNLSMEDKLGGNRAAALVLEALRGVPTKSPGSLKETSTPITPEFVVFCKAVPQLWSASLAPLGLSLSEYRVLDAAREAPGPVRSADLARALLLDRSAVSLLKDGMVEKGLVSFSPVDPDRRNSLLALLPEGEMLAIHARDGLQKETDRAYSLCDDAFAKQVNSWHERMFQNINVLNAAI